jgi:signal peptidase complex subunit 2
MYLVSNKTCLFPTTPLELTLTDCKNTTDDALQNYLNSLKFRQSHWYTDLKLALGYSAVIIAAVTFALDYKYGFEATKRFTTLAVVVYFILNAAFTFCVWHVENGLVYVGAWKGRKVYTHSLTHSPPTTTPYKD